ncbi:MAG: hypothetical protein ACFB0B_13670 [Thermonemataceae bacterium]
MLKYNKKKQVVGVENEDKINWKMLAKREQLSETFIEAHLDQLNWLHISKFQSLSNSFIYTYADRLDWNALSENQALSTNILLDFSDRIRWKKATLNPQLDAEAKLVATYKGNLEKLLQKEQVSVDFLRKYSTYLDWEVVSATQAIPEKHIQTFIEKINFSSLLQHPKAYSEKMLKKYSRHFDKACWLAIVQHQELSENFLQTFEQSIDWPSVAKYQRLSESFIEEYKYLLNWKDIRKYQKHLSDQYLAKHAKFKLEEEYARMTENFLRELADEARLDWQYVSQYSKLSERFIEDFKQKLEVIALRQNTLLTREVRLYVEEKLAA